MVRHVIAALVSILALPSVAQQLSNSGFESWTTTSGYEVPATPWVVLTEYVPSSFVVTGAKSTDKFSGSYALALKPYDEVNQLGFSTILKLENDYYPFSFKPYSFEGYYKYDGVSGDQVHIYVEVLKSTADPQNPELLGSGDLLITSDVATYTKFVVPVNYISSLTPDRISVVFKMENNQTSIGTILTLDDVAFGYTPITSIANNVSELDGLEINNNMVGFTDENLTGSFEVLDMIGKPLMSSEDSNNIDFSSLPAGAYLVRISTPAGRNQIVKVVH